MKLEDPEFKALLLQSASLRGEHHFDDAIKLIDGHFGQLEGDDSRSIALRELHLAAREAGFTDASYRNKAVDYAHRLLAIEPEMPSALATLNDWA